MGLFDKIVCPRCGTEYSFLKGACPKCGLRRASESARAASPSDSTRRGSSAEARQMTQSRWQLVFGLCLVAAVIIAVIVLIVTSVNGGYQIYPAASPSVEVSESPSQRPSPTPSPSPSPSVESITITYVGDERTEFSVGVGGTVPLGATIFPIEIEAEVTWSSQNSDICTISANGVVTGVSKGTTKIVASCYGVTQECTVYVV